MAISSHNLDGLALTEVASPGAAGRNERPYALAVVDPDPKLRTRLALQLGEQADVVTYSEVAALAEYQPPGRSLVVIFGPGLADAPGLVSGLLLQSYPLHPPGKPDNVRTAHLPRLRVPTLFVHGATDPFATPAELASIRPLIPARTEVITINAGHDLGWSRARASDLALPVRIATAFLELTQAR